MTPRAFGLAALATVALAAGADTDATSTDAPDRLQNLGSWNEARAIAKSRNLPIVLLVEQRHCAFCQRLKRDVFRPIANDAAFFDRVLFASVLTDFDGPTIEVDGKALSGFEFAGKFDANTTPTVLFLDHLSKELQPRSVGYVAGAEYKEKFVGKIERSIRAVASDD